MNQLEYTTELDVYYDFCLWEYKPVASPINKFRSVNLLYNSFDVAGAHKLILNWLRLSARASESQTLYGEPSL